MRYSIGISKQADTFIKGLHQADKDFLVMNLAMMVKSRGVHSGPGVEFGQIADLGFSCWFLYLPDNGKKEIGIVAQFTLDDFGVDLFILYGKEGAHLDQSERNLVREIYRETKNAADKGAKP